MLRAKADLQEVVISQDYNNQRFSSRGHPTAPSDEHDDAEELDAGIGQRVKAIVLDENGFWSKLVIILHVAMPLIKLLRTLDSNRPVMGKIYDRMYLIGERLQQLEQKGIPWATEMRKKHAERWEYLHSPFHAAAYALDPEFMETVGELDGSTQDGLLTVIERLCLRDAILAAEDPEVAWLQLTTSSSEVVARTAQVRSANLWHLIIYVLHDIIALRLFVVNIG